MVQLLASWRSLAAQALLRARLVLMELLELLVPQALLALLVLLVQLALEYLLEARQDKR